MLNLRKTVSSVLAAAMVTAGFTTAMAAEESAVKLLQYEDFNYNANANLNTRTWGSINGAKVADAARGFSTGLVDISGNASIADGWTIYSENGSYAPYYIKATKFSNARVYRTAAEGKAIKMNPGTDGQNIYFITWEQYFDKNAQYSDGGCVEFVVNSTKGGMKFKDGATYPYFRWGTNNEYYGETALEGGITYNMVVKIEANSKEIDKVSLMAYPKGENMKAEWDIDFEIAAGSTLSAFGINAATKKVDDTSSSDVRFADYRVELISGTAAVEAYNNTLFAIDAVAACEAEGDELDMLNYTAETLIAKLGDTAVAELMNEKLASALGEKEAKYIYEPVLVAKEDFNYNKAFDLDDRNLAGIENPVATGFTSKWVSSSKDAVQIATNENSWRIKSSKGEGAPYYIKANKYSTSKYYRITDTNSTVKTNPGVDNENVYYITWEQYFADGVVIANADVLLHYDDVRAGFKWNAEDGKAYPYVYWLEDYVGTTPVEPGKTYKMVLRIEANSTTPDKIKLMAYPKAEKAKTEWDVEFEKAAGTPWASFGLNISSLVAGTSSDQRFANYCTELFSGAEKVEFLKATEKAIAENSDNAQAMLDSLLDCGVKEVFEAQLMEDDAEIKALNDEPSWDAYNAIQERLNKLPASAEKAEKQAKLDVIASDNGYTQFIVNADGIDENGKLVAEDKMNISVETANRDKQIVIVAAYTAEGRLANAYVAKYNTFDEDGNIIPDGKVEETVEIDVAGVDSVKIITLNSLVAITPEIGALVFER